MGVNDTLFSQMVTHSSTNRARCSLTSVIRRELVLSAWYDRWRWTAQSHWEMGVTWNGVFWINLLICLSTVFFLLYFIITLTHMQFQWRLKLHVLVSQCLMKVDLNVHLNETNWILTKRIEFEIFTFELFIIFTSCISRQWGGQPRFWVRGIFFSNQMELNPKPPGGRVESGTTLPLWPSVAKAIFTFVWAYEKCKKISFFAFIIKTSKCFSK